jgi:hypothetical protein
MKVSVILTAVLCIGCMFPCSMNGESISQISYRPLCQNQIQTISVLIEIPSYSIVETSNGEKILVEDFGRLSEPGEPFLPSKIFSIAIPPSATFVALTFDLGEKKAIPGSHDICPIEPSILPQEYPDLTKEQTERYQSRVASIYSSDDPYPSQIVTLIGTSGYREYNLVDIQVSPFVYTPYSGIITYYPQIILHVSYVLPAEGGKEVYYRSSFFDKIAQHLILNYDPAQQWYTTTSLSPVDQYDFVIITLDSLAEAVEPLVQWETEKGRTVRVVTKTWIESEYPGYDTAEKIRNFLRDKYPVEQWGIQDVLIVGHYDDIPLRKVAQTLEDNDPRPETDFYYAELSRPDNESWDANGDHEYGDNTDPIDYYAEVSVGRIPWSESETVSHICEKSIAYEQNTDPSFKNNILLLAAFIDEQTDGATYTEYLANSSHNPWMDYWMKTRLYDRESTYPYDSVLNQLNVVRTWSEGTFSVVAMHAHGSPYTCGGFITTDDCQYLNDNYPSIISSAACSNSDTDYLNIGQAMLRQGAVGFIGSNKAAFYRSQWDDPSDGSDQSFNYFFTSALTSGSYTQGQALQYALQEMYTRNLWVRQKYETYIHSSLWGNPDIGLSSSSNNTAPLKPDTPTGPASGKANVAVTFSTKSTDPDGDDLYYCWSWGDGTIDWFGPYNSDTTCEVQHTWTAKDNYNIKVKAKDIYGKESPWSDPLPIAIPYVYNTPMVLFMELLFQRLPNAFTLLRQLMRYE